MWHDIIAHVSFSMKTKSTTYLFFNKELTLEIKISLFSALKSKKCGYIYGYVHGHGYKHGAQGSIKNQDMAMVGILKKIISYIFDSYVYEYCQGRLMVLPNLCNCQDHLFVCHMLSLVSKL